ncbi:MAG: hypothetical protein FWE28_08935 [Oscillospiraceae bacterium]|nr:hypothetical protein [Oscillospiraceae bacterium]
MTREESIRLTGLEQIGTEKNAVGRGLVLGFPAEAVPTKHGLHLYLFLEAEFSGKQRKALNQQLKEDEMLKGKVSISNPIGEEDAVWHMGNMFRVDMNFKNEEPKPTYDAALRLVETFLTEEAIRPATSCAICGQSGGDSVARYENRLALVHRACLQQWQREQSQKLELKQQNAGYFRGLIGGLIGGLVGAVPALGAMYFINFFVGVLFALIPLGIYFGWKLFGGKLSIVTTVFTILYTLVVALATEVVHLWLILREEFPEFQFTIRETLDFYLDFEFFREYLMIDTLMALGFAIVGIWIAWRQIRQTDASAAQDTVTVLEEAVSVGGHTVRD